MKKRYLYTLIFSIFLIFILASCATPTPSPAPSPTPSPTPTPSAKPVELKFANFFPPVARMSTLGEDFIKDIDSRTNGRVKITYFPGGSLLSPTTMFDGVAEGQADIGYSHIGYYRDLFPATEVLTMPLNFASGWVDVHVSNDFYDKFKPKEWDKVKVLLLAGNGPKVIHMRDKPVRKMEDLKGMKIRAPGRAGEMMTALGATPIPTPMPEAYDAVSKGVIDGLHLPFEPLVAWKMAEVTKYTTNCWQLGAVDVFFLIMNNDSWNKLPAADQKIFGDTVNDYKEIYAKAWNDLDFEGRDAALEHGNEIIELSPDEANRWVAAMTPVIDSYVQAMVGKGYSEAEVREWISFIQERLDYWTKKQIEAGIKSATGPQELR